MATEHAQATAAAHGAAPDETSALGRAEAAETHCPDDTAATPPKEGSLDDFAKAGQAQGGKKPRTFAVILFVLFLLSFVAAIDSTIVSVGLSTITRDLRGDSVTAWWVSTSFLVASTVAMPIIGSVSEIVGRRACMLAAVILFTVGSVVAGVAHNMATVLAGRTVQGLGGGGILVMSEIVIADMTTLAERGKFLSLLGAAWALGTTVGPLLGGAFTESNWRWMFFFNLPFCGIAMVLVVVFFRLHIEDQTWIERVKRVDWIGIFVYTASMTSFLVPLIWGGSLFAWSSWHTIVPLVLGVVGLAGFILFEAYIPAEPMLPLRLFRDWSVGLGYFQDFVQSVAVWLAIYYPTLYIQGARFSSPMRSAVLLLGLSLTCAPAAAVAGNGVALTGKWKQWNIAGWVGTVAGTGMLIKFSPSVSTAYMEGAFVVFGVGAGMLFASIQFSVISGLTELDTPLGLAAFALIRSLGQAFGVAVGGIIYQNKFSDLMPASLRKAYPDLDPVEITAQLRFWSDDNPYKQVVASLISRSIRYDYYFLLALVGAAAITSLVQKHYSLDREHVTKQGLKHSESRNKDIETAG